VEADPIGNAVINLTKIARVPGWYLDHDPVTTMSGVTMLAVQAALREVFDLGR
jgi:hypothetical protein